MPRTAPANAKVPRGTARRGTLVTRWSRCSSRTIGGPRSSVKARLATTRCEGQREGAQRHLIASLSRPAVRAARGSAGSRGRPGAFFLAQTPPRDEEHRHRAVDRAQPLGELPAVHPGHPDVRQHHVVTAALVDLQGGRAADGGAHGVARRLEQRHQRGQHLRVIIDEEHTGRAPGAVARGRRLDVRRFLGLACQAERRSPTGLRPAISPLMPRTIEYAHREPEPGAASPFVG